MSFPPTKYMGSKQAILPFILESLTDIPFDSVLDAFSGSACVAYAFKHLGKRVVANDFLRFAYHMAKATVENNGTRLDARDLRALTRRSKNAPTLIRETFQGLYFNEVDCEFLDNLWFNLSQLSSPLKRSIALAAASRACMKKRPRGLFTFVGRKGWDGRRDLKLSMQQQFIEAVAQLNESVFTNRRRNRAVCRDAFSLPGNGVDLVYIDTPYISPYSDCDYTRRYHFVEGFCTYWEGVEIQHHTKTKKIRSRATPFCSPRTASDAFRRLFAHFRRPILAVSYSSNGVPGKEEMVALLGEVKGRVRVHEIPHRYSVANHGHKVDDNNNRVKEYLFVAS